ncbi:LuxR family transcriptional regulator [Geodermatophilus arenarius]
MGDTTTGGSGLVGRETEDGVVRAFLARAADRGDALVVTGDPGVGRTAVLDAAAGTAAATGALVLRAAGVGSETEVGHAGLSQLLLPLLDGPEGPPGGALAAVLGVRPGAPPGPLAVASAVLALVDRAARGRPVLLVVDDLPELDRSSARVLGLVARRLPGRRCGFLAAARTGGDPLPDTGLPRLELGPLDEAASAELLRTRAPALPASVRRRVLDAARGNPLALLELPAVLTGDDGGPVPLPPGTRLHAVFARPVGALPAPTRALLLLAALEGTGDLRALRAAALADGRWSDDGWLDDLAPAERARLVRVDLAAGRVALRHPLTGAAAVELASSGDRLRAHAALARALAGDPERCAGHLAQATLGPDGEAAGLLERAAGRARQRGDGAGAVALLLRAADLTPPGPARARWLPAAAVATVDTTGDLPAVPGMLARAHADDPRAGRPAPAAAAAAAHLLHAVGDVGTAHLVLARGAATALDEGPGPAAVADALPTLLLACHLAGREDLWRPFDDALARLGTDVPPVLAVAARTLADPARATRADLGRLDDLVTAVQTDADPVSVVRVAAAAAPAGRLAACRPALRRLAAGGGGSRAAALAARVLLAQDGFAAGRWDEAGHTAAEAVREAGRLGYRLLALPAVHVLALLAAARGDEEAVRSRAGDLAAAAAAHGAGLAVHLAAHARGLAALGRGERGVADRHLAALGPTGRLAPHAPVALSAALDVVEAAVRTGRRAQAAAHVAALRRAPVSAAAPGPALLLAGAAALVAPEEEARGCFEAALAVPGAQEHPFELARVRLAHGEHLRRARAPGAARGQLAAALEVLERLGATPWAARASAELRATGPSARRTDGGRGPASLTAQEYEIAMLAASGLSNKQIGTRLFLSPRTVGAHLYRAFPKLGVTARAALRDALAGVPTPRPPSER